MASRRFFAYDPWCSYSNDDPYYQQQPASSRRARGIFADDDPYYQQQPSSSRRARGFFAGDDQKAATAGTKPKAKVGKTKISIPIPVHGPDTDPERERERKAAARVVAPAMPVDEAAVRMQAAARGFLVRKSVWVVRDVERLAKLVGSTIENELKALLADERARVVIEEALMRMLLRLDAVRFAREYRRKVTRRVIQLQDAVDALQLNLKEAAEADVVPPEEKVSEMAEESAAATEHSSGMEEGLEVDEAVADGEPEAEKEAEGDQWEMVTTEEHTAPAAATPTSHDHEVLPCQEQEQEQEQEQADPTESAGASDGVDMRQVMEMVAALCKQSEQQCAVIGALAERVDALERTVRRMEDAKKMSTTTARFTAIDACSQKPLIN